MLVEKMRSPGIKISICVTILKILALIITVTADFLHENYPASVIEDSTLDTPNLLKKYNYPVETHHVTTEDNYILCLHRIPKPQGPPIFLMHGILDSSATWILMAPSTGLGYYLYEQGFDVWMGNARGNVYSRNHTIFNPNTDGSFWKFSWHEIGFYDIPAMIDYVLKETNQKKLTYIGHSQGTTSFFVMCSMRPAFNAKINSMHAISPVAFMKHIKTPLLPLGRTLLNIFDGKLSEMLPQNGLLPNICFRTKITLNTCTDFLYLAMGKESKHINATMMPIVFGHVPAGSALNQVKHYIQLIDSDRFRRFDYGSVENTKHYGKATPPDYSLQNISAPVALYYTQNDYLTSEVDVQRLARLLPNVIENNLLPYKKWGHLTAVWGFEARKLLHTRVLQIIKKFA